MKEDLNIDELFKSKFENFESQVDPSAWANISQSIGAGASSGAGAAGLSGFAKVAIITGVAAITSVAVWYFSPDSDTEQTQNNIEVKEDVPVSKDDSQTESGINENSNSESLNSNNSSETNNESSVVLEGSDESTENTSSETTSDRGLESDIEDIEIITNNLEDNETSISTLTTQTNEIEDEDEGQNTLLQEKPLDLGPMVESNPVFTVEGNEVHFISNAKHHTSVKWEFGDGKVSSGDELVHTYSRPGTYKVRITVDGKTGSSGAELEVVIKGTSSISQVPNIITPNGDNKNDYLFIESEGLTNFTIVINSLTSQKQVFTSNNPDFRWYGDDQEGNVEAGKYSYVINAVGEDGQLFQRAGTFIIQ